MGLQTRERGTSMINPDSDVFGVLSVCDENKTEVFGLVSTIQWLTIKQAGLALLTTDYADTTTVFEPLMRIPTAVPWWLTASSRPCISLKV